MSSKVKSRPRRVSASLGRSSASDCSTSSIWSRSILLMMSAILEWVSAPVLRATFSSRSSCSVRSSRRIIGSITGRGDSMRRIRPLRRSRGVWAMIFAAVPEDSLERTKAKVCGCSFWR